MQNVDVFLLYVPHLGHITSPVWNGLVAIGRAADSARRAEVMKPLQVAALALPVPDRVADEFELRHSAEIRDRKHGVEHGLKPGVFALLGSISIWRNRSYEFFCTSIRFGIWIEPSGFSRNSDAHAPGHDDSWSTLITSSLVGNARKPLCEDSHPYASRPAR